MLDQLGVADQILFHHDQFEFNDPTCPPHDWHFANRLRRYEGVDRLVYLERTPQDVMVSLYYQVTGRFNDFFHYQGSLSDFIRDDYFGAENLQCFRLMWQEIAKHKPLLWIRYEDCHQNAEQVIRQVVDYYELVVTDQQIRKAVAAASYENMKALEASDEFHQPWLRLRQGAPKVRKGKVNGYRDELSVDDQHYLHRIFTP